MMDEMKDIFFLIRLNLFVQLIGASMDVSKVKQFPSNPKMQHVSAIDSSNLRPVCESRSVRTWARCG